MCFCGKLTHSPYRRPKGFMFEKSNHRVHPRKKYVKHFSCLFICLVGIPISTKSLKTHHSAGKKSSHIPHPAPEKCHFGRSWDGWSMLSNWIIFVDIPTSKRKNILSQVITPPLHPSPPHTKKIPRTQLTSFLGGWPSNFVAWILQNTGHLGSYKRVIWTHWPPNTCLLGGSSQDL